ncbi:ribosomal RNA-processing protein 7 homolog A-like [Saccoglossus kowalevskii]|uniref:Ribosomal RNA-processing protein 7 homolog A-like n=1 Tax=Saccoglossus kowalevskii TaxID=10224 RepID=A0ABM0GZV5_SACKO|nr:PREDICTED: ribosomal RNA-processing protein 7 homolog A-like [Saccoglossus kowalevskii]
MAAPMNSVAGFKVMPVKLNNKSDVVRYFYYKEHNVREKDSSKPSDRTLFVVNIPAYCNEECLQRLFSQCGTVESVHFQQKPGISKTKTAVEESTFFKQVNLIKGYKVAYVIFKNPSGLQNAKKFNYKQPLLLSTEESPIFAGMKKWCKEYIDSIPDTTEMQKEIDEYMANYDRQELEEEEKTTELEGVADSDGWITVTRKGRKPGLARTEVNQTKATVQEKKKREKTELLNFYRFQFRESKREHIAQLRKRFEEDKEKIVAMKAARKFKPY